MSNQDDKKDPRKILVVGGASVPSELIARLAGELAQKDIVLYGRKEALEKGIPILDEEPQCRDGFLDSMPAPVELRPEVPKRPKPVEPWRVKKGRFKGHFPRYR